MRFFKHVLMVMVALAAWSGAWAHGPDSDEYRDRMIVTRHFTGIWDQVDHESQGLALQVVEQLDGSRRAVGYWYTYGDDRATAWL